MKRILITFSFSFLFLILLQIIEIESLVSNNDQQVSTQVLNNDIKNHIHGNGNIAKAAIDVVDARVMTAGAIECTRCGGTRLIGCMFGRCFYRCYRRCNDGNGTTYDEAVRFTLPGHRR